MSADLVLRNGRFTALDRSNPTATALAMPRGAIRRTVQAGVTPITWLAVFGEWQRDWARTETLGALAEVLVQHGGASGIAFAWEMQLLDNKAKAA
jgi:hypothetical protein